MHSNISECDTELEIPSKKIKLSSPLDNCKTRERILSKVLQKEIQQEINLRKEDLETIEGNIFLVRQKLTHLKQVLAAEYYHQKSVKGCLQYPHHPAVKDTFVGKSPAGYDKKSSTTSILNEAEAFKSKGFVKKEFDNAKQVSSNDTTTVPSATEKKLFACDKLPCYIPPKNSDDNVVKPTEPRGIDSKKEIRIIVGNVSKWLAPLEVSDATHKWTVYAKLAQTDMEISLFVKKVVFYLHKSYRPNDIIEIKYPPFKLTRRGWGEFPLKAQFHFKSPENPPIDVMHHLKLDQNHTGFETFGAETSLTVWVHYPTENKIIENKKKPSEEIIIKTENLTERNEYQIANKLNTYEHNTFENSGVISDISLNANIDSFENEIHSGGFSFPEHSCDSESINSLFDEIKHEELQSFSSLISSYEDKNNHTNQNFISGYNWNETENNSSNNKNIEDKTFSHKIFPEFNSNVSIKMEVKSEVEEKSSLTQNFEEDNSLGKKIIQVEAKGDENVSEINFNELEQGLFVDECAVVAEEIIIDGDDGELDDSKTGRIEENKNKSVDAKDYQLPSENNISNILLTSAESDLNISSNASNFVTVKKQESSSSTPEISLDRIVEQLGLDIIDAGRNQSEADKCGQARGTEILSILQDQKSNKIIQKNSIEGINSSVLNNNNKKLHKNIEKKSMIITLQKENGQIILRKEAKVQKFKESSPKKGPIAIEKKPILVNNKSLANTNVDVPAKNSRIIVDAKKQPGFRLLSQLTNVSKSIPSVSKLVLNGNSTVQKKSVPGVSILKKVKNINKEDDYEEISNRDLVGQCPVQNTEIAVNWLMKKFPLVDARSSISSFHVRHPYCAKDRDTFLNWPLAKQRAAEWMRAKAIGRILNEIPHLQKWTTLEILDWARVRCYTPIKNIPEYDGPTVEPSLDFVYRPRIDGVVEFLKQEKILTEKEIVDVTSDKPAKDEVSASCDDVEPASASHDIASSITLPLDQQLVGFTSFVNKCMTNAVGKKPSPEELLPNVRYPAVERVLVSVFSSIAEELIRRSYNASWIRHCDNPPPEISITDVQAAIVSRKEFDFLLPFSENKGKEQASIMSYFRK